MSAEYEWEIDEKGVVFFRFNKVHRTGGEVVCDVSLTLHKFSVVFQHGRVIAAPVAGTESVVFIDSSSIGMIGGLHSIVPLSKCGGGVARCFKILEDGAFIKVHAFLAAAR